MTTHNRVAVTLRCLNALAAVETDDDVELTVVLADAGSSDGTLKAVLEAHPDVVSISLTSDKYWAEGMRSAWEQAQSLDYDYILWLNDDVVLGRLALTTLLDTLDCGSHRAVAVGALVDPVTGEVTYSGFRQRSKLLRPLALEPVLPDSEVMECDTLNGNVVLIPAEIDRELGGFPHGYVHGMADLAYGFAARRSGFPVLVHPDPVGLCSRNPVAGSWEDPGLRLNERFKTLAGPKGLPPRVWIRFCIRHGGIVGPLLAMSPYMRVLVTSLKYKFKNRRGGERG
ncbi:glycosyltransferase family 2 protein [Rhodococcus sp. NPDC058639]|uniref:glycosyltransferase family 2 protein n=1 Tax=Rhodococcus sp. NPDC058639 TaxID=3346570 RepID=UPI003659FCE9